jgi:hypothetical protein
VSAGCRQSDALSIGVGFAVPGRRSCRSHLNLDQYDIGLQFPGIAHWNWTGVAWIRDKIKLSWACSSIGRLRLQFVALYIGQRNRSVGPLKARDRGGTQESSLSSTRLIGVYGD